MTSFDLQEEVRRLQEEGVDNYSATHLAIPGFCVSDDHSLEARLNELVDVLESDPCTLNDHSQYCLLAVVVKNLAELRSERQHQVFGILTSGIRKGTDAAKYQLALSNQTAGEATDAYTELLERLLFLAQWAIRLVENNYSPGGGTGAGPTTGAGSAATGGSRAGARPRGSGSRAQSRASGTGAGPGGDLTGAEAACFAEITRMMGLIPLERLWPMPPRRRLIVDLLTAPIYSLFARPTALQHKSLRGAMFLVLAECIIRYNHNSMAVSSIIQLLTYFSHTSEPLAQLVATLVEKGKWHNTLNDILLEICRLNFTATQENVKHFAVFLTSLVEFAPHAVAPRLPYLISQQMDSPAYQMRQAMAEVIGCVTEYLLNNPPPGYDPSNEQGEATGSAPCELSATEQLVDEQPADEASAPSAPDSAAEEGTGETALAASSPPGGDIADLIVDETAEEAATPGEAGDGESPEGPAAGTISPALALTRYQRDLEDFLHIIEQRFMDTSSFVRSRIVLWAGRLMGNRRLPPTQRARFAEAVYSRLMDRSSITRRSGLQTLCRLLAQVNGPADVAVVARHGPLSPALARSLERIDQVFTDAVEHAVLMLNSSFKTDVIEAISLIVAAWEHGVSASRAAARSMVHLVWARHIDHSPAPTGSADAEESAGGSGSSASGKSVKDHLVDAYLKLYFSPSRALAPLESAAHVVRGLFGLVNEMTSAELSSLEELFVLINERNVSARTQILPRDMERVLWTYFTSSLPDAGPNAPDVNLPEFRRCSIIILSMLAHTPSQAADMFLPRLEAISQVGLAAGRPESMTTTPATGTGILPEDGGAPPMPGPTLAVADPLLARYSCIALQKLNPRLTSSKRQMISAMAAAASSSSAASGASGASKRRRNASNQAPMNLGFSRFAPDHFLAPRLAEIIYDFSTPINNWMVVVEQAIGCVYQLFEHPDIIMGQLIKMMTSAVFVLSDRPGSASASAPASASAEAHLTDERAAPSTDFTNLSEDSLSRLLFVVGHVALKQITHLETIDRNWKRAHSAAKDRAKKIGQDAKLHDEKERKKRQRQSKGDLQPPGTPGALLSSSGNDGARDSPAVAAQKARQRLSVRQSMRKSEGPAAGIEDDLEQVSSTGNAEDDFADTLLIVREDELLTGPRSLLSVFGPIIVQICQQNRTFDDEVLQQTAVLALCKFMCVSSDFCASNLQLLFTILEKSPDEIIRSNIVLAVGDMLICFNNIVGENIEHMYYRLSDRSLTVRKNTLMVLSHLILNGMIKVKGHIADIALLTLDPHGGISSLAKLFFSELATKDNSIYNNMPDMISNLALGNRNLPVEDFRKVARFLLSFVTRDRQASNLVSRLRARAATVATDRQREDLAFCISQLVKDKAAADEIIRSLLGSTDAMAEAADSTEPAVLDPVTGSLDAAAVPDAETDVGPAAGLALPLVEPGSGVSDPDIGIEHGPGKKPSRSVTIISPMSDDDDDDDDDDDSSSSSSPSDSDLDSESDLDSDAEPGLLASAPHPMSPSFMGIRRVQGLGSPVPVTPGRGSEAIASAAFSFQARSAAAGRRAPGLGECPSTMQLLHSPANGLAAGSPQTPLVGGAHLLEAGLLSPGSGSVRRRLRDPESRQSILNSGGHRRKRRLLDHSPTTTEEDPDDQAMRSAESDDEEDAN
ncbi:hypothetical protein H696_00448 [Fonticula alba]|uniref:Condensin complex subunit 1 n=1 Tax=Fonticula alba TaxID=691883 RepID=A0A058ZHC0_FONAL|nr:hypothetical protein H696_00448 [Fonticula alba]KCV72877.1 hypothetical protein H696_00448 [Fonticula alba]|eukprot:XP_009492578.1 hypothetical protein H696_00448 [Fonticula alba]